YRLTAPWLNEGPRILPASAYYGYAEKMRALRQKYEAAADTFTAKYPGHIEARAASLNGMFCESDYPSPSRIRSYFGFDLILAPLPDADDFRVTLNDADLAT